MSRIVLSVTMVFVLIGLVGCDRPGPIEVYKDEAREPAEVTLLLGKQNDTLVVAESTYDFTGLLNEEEDAYPATMLVNGVKSDLDGNRVVYSYSRVILRDKNSPLTISGRFGQLDDYRRLDVGTVRVNGTVLERYEAIIQIRSLTLLPVRAGVFYKLVNEGNEQTKPFVFRASTEYALDADGKNNIAPFVKRINSPDEITLTEPKPYSLSFRDEDLVLRWQGKAGQRVNVLISLYDEEQKLPGKPIMLLKPSVKANALLIPSKLLQLVPRTSSGRYVLTIISSNRAEEQVAGYSGKVLVQSSSIHNVAVTLR